MRTSIFSALIFALLTSTSVAVSADPSSQPPVSQSAMMENAAPAAALEQRNDRVNLNTADAQTLQKELAGIGKNKADAIVAYRDANGEFTSVDELIEVKGIGKAILERNREKLAID
ncbi:helix-hairpin-helix domain-containing protein [Pseudomonas syringae pv. tagetis]|uniref:Competence protein ComEA helix-hairpin-helix region n=2 Tax=Pseudomonas syringae group genomosp. 7 TaxID=251699 RepID=A0A0Q0AZB5_9PSED|nr:helix-hairpin-helix domain-containing protein [Pseudomonas syringae group genomosp. 7]KPX41467.1 Competence protein ComEA helix-hairpin-helix region [Pseudomonas syringae pv. helianthi]KPY82522.1 Competence protein ComEA helix-hairpin-helix region [Pseudomonas syringae pv. tagetis]RMR03747.1 Competence protein ComEA helix-hairpin-helix region [Pseudomonas syringae pv. helianthi]RMV43903.1 Competence protein ComEA helix-hairpin-helix region [Pseudomonas syringae pv. helianthi]RMW11101.1 Comp